MTISKQHWVLAAVGAVLFVSGAALGQTIDRYAEAQATLTKAQALLNAVEIKTKPEQRQRDKALASLAKAQAQISCAQLRAENPKAVCQ